MHVKQLITVLSLIAVLLLAGCGGKSGGSGGSPKDAASAYFKALESGDYKAACEKIAAASKKKLQTAAAGKSCPDALTAGLKTSRGATTLKALKGATFGEAKVTGDKGNVPVKIKALPKPVPIPVVKEDGEWKVESGAASAGS